MVLVAAVGVDWIYVERICVAMAGKYGAGANPPWTARSTSFFDVPPFPRLLTLDVRALHSRQAHIRRGRTRPHQRRNTRGRDTCRCHGTKFAAMRSCQSSR